MANRTEIINMAILLIGELPISDPEEDNKASNAADVWFQQCLESALTEHDWTFARKRATLSPSTEAPVFGYSTKFPVPADYNHIVIEETDEEIDFREELGHLHYDAETMDIIYISNSVELELLKPKFVDAFAELLASKIIYVMTASDKLMIAREQLYEKRLQKAKGFDGAGIGLVEERDSWDEDR